MFILVTTGSVLKSRRLELLGADIVYEINGISGQYLDASLENKNVLNLYVTLT